MNRPVVAIVQMEPRHEMIMTSIADAALRAGWSPKIIVDKGCFRRRGDIFAETPNLGYEITYANFGRDGTDVPDLASSSGGKVLDEIAGSGADLIVMNSFHRERSINWAKQIKKPVIAVIHSVDQFLGDPSAAAVVGDMRFQFLTLGHHVASELVARIGKQHTDRIEVIEPNFWSSDDPRPMRTPSGGQRRIAIPGGISLRTRNYAGLLDELSENRTAYKGLRFVLGSGGKDRQKIEQETHSRELSSQFEYLPLVGDQVSHSVYFDSLRRSQAILPLTPNDFEQYHRGRITTVVASAVGFAVPVVMDRWSSWCYRAPMFVAGASLRAQLAFLRDVHEEELDRMRARLIEYRRESLMKNGEAFLRLGSAALP